MLFLFSSLTLEHYLASNGLPTIPLIPVSSSQAVVGAVIGIGLLKGAKGIRWRALGKIASGWVTMPIIASFLCFVMLFFLQNVFNQTVFRPVTYILSAPVVSHLEAIGVPVAELKPLQDQTVSAGVRFRESLRTHTTLSEEAEQNVIAAAVLYPLHIGPMGLARIDRNFLDPSQVTALDALAGRSFSHKWQLDEALLAAQTPAWRRLEDNKRNKAFNKHLEAQLAYVHDLFQLTGKT